MPTATLKDQTSENGKAAAEAQIRKIMNHWAEAARAKDSRGYSGSHALKRRAEEWLSSFKDLKP